jgi:hypothetical protein
MNSSSYLIIIKNEHERAKIKYPKLFNKKKVKKLPTINENYYTIQYLLDICVENIENYIRICHIDKIGWG